MPLLRFDVIEGRDDAALKKITGYRPLRHG